MEFYIQLHSSRQVQEFVELAAVQPFDISVGNDHQSINGKDLMGMFSLDYTHPVRVTLGCSPEQFTAFRVSAAPYIV